MKHNPHEKFDYFYLLPNFISRANTSFTGYVNEEGTPAQLFDGKKDKNGDLIPIRFSLSYRQRDIRMPKTRVDMFGNSYSEYLRNSPFCEGSKLQKERGTIPWYKEIREDGDAAIAVDSKLQRIEAENKAITLTDEERIAVAQLLGVFSDKPNIQKHRVLEFAGGSPKEFMDIINDVNFKKRALIRQGVKNGVIKVTGTVHVWGETTLGYDEDDAIASLLKSKDLDKGLTLAVKKSV